MELLPYSLKSKDTSLMVLPVDSSMSRTNFLPFEWTKPASYCWCGAVIKGTLSRGKKVVNLTRNYKLGLVFLHAETSISSSTSWKISGNVGFSKDVFSCSCETVLCFFFGHLLVIREAILLMAWKPSRHFRYQQLLWSGSSTYLACWCRLSPSQRHHSTAICSFLGPKYDLDRPLSHYDSIGWTWYGCKGGQSTSKHLWSMVRQWQLTSSIVNLLVS
jgi:hypothetical protein